MHCFEHEDLLSKVSSWYHSKQANKRAVMQMTKTKARVSQIAYLKAESHCIHWSAECDTAAATFLLNHTTSMRSYRLLQDGVIDAHGFGGSCSIALHQLCNTGPGVMKQSARTANRVGYFSSHCGRPVGNIHEQQGQKAMVLQMVFCTALLGHRHLGCLQNLIDTSWKCPRPMNPPYLYSLLQ